MKKGVLLAFAAILPLFVFANVWQSCRYARLRGEVRQKETEQVEWLEQNRRLITGIAVLSSPERLDRIARKELGLERVPPEHAMTVQFSKKGDQDG